MNDKHYKNELSAYVNHEMPASERQVIAEHILICADCRTAHDDIRFAAGLAAELVQSDAPGYVWNQIETAIYAEKQPARFSYPFFSLRTASAAALIMIALGIALFVQFGQRELPENAANEKETSIPEITSFQNASPQILPVEATPATIAPKVVASPETETSSFDEVAAALANKTPTPSLPRTSVRVTKPKTKIPVASWDVETLSGNPQIGDSSNTKKLAVGEVLETDENSRVRVAVADIGHVEIAPNSRVKLVTTKTTEHRLSLERGTLHAKILAPPRLFIVDTPTATAVDLGCEYTLDVDENGDVRLHVISGFVALENGDFESIVPAGAIALTKKGRGVGTPFAEQSSAEFKAALSSFDFADGGSAALEIVVKEASVLDSLTLWHLLSRVGKEKREIIFDALAKRIKPPAKVTRDGILRLDKLMLEAWWAEIENVWFE